MDIFNRAPAISEDTLRYILYPAPDSADRTSVASLAALVQSFVDISLPNHIWHRDPFELKIVSDDEVGPEKWRLEGHMRVGDSVDDEWCAVWLLKEISSRWDVVVSAFDSDGEFLLIEAADFLPSWVSPENAENRVWLYRGRLHLIPLSFISAPSTKPPEKRRYNGNDSDDDGLGHTDEDWLSVEDALNVLRTKGETEASEAVELAILKRIEGYPERARSHIHVANAVLPVDIAKALSQDPSLVQKAAETFYTRDAVQLRAVHRMSRFPPEPSVLTAVRMTRTAYAQLSGQKFHPPKVFGRFKEREGTKEWKWRDVGMKIACGFEMLYQEEKTHSKVDSDSVKAADVATRDALGRDLGYTAYIQKLRIIGYFKNEIEGSKLWSELEEKAVNVYISAKRDDDVNRESFALVVNRAVTRAQDSTGIIALNEDPDDWLNIDAASFDEKLTQTFRDATAKGNSGDAMDVDKQPSDAEDTLAQDQADKLKHLAKKIEGFVEGQGTLEGAVVDGDKSSEGESLSEFSDEEEPSAEESEQDNPSESDKIRQEALERLVTGIEPSEYGKMPPSYYRNSQKVAPVTLESEMRNSGVSNSKVPSGDMLPRKPIRRPILTRDKYDGIDSDDESDEGSGGDGDDSEEDRPQIVGDVEVDMAEEQEEFLQFTREALGITEDMWNEIVRERTDRGAFVPKISKSEKEMRQKVESLVPREKGEADKAPVRSGSRTSGPKPNADPNLSSFEAVMDAMEAELAKARSTRPTSSAAKTGIMNELPKVSQKSKGKGKEKALGTVREENVDVDEDIESAMDDELRAALARDDGDSGDEEPMDYGLIKNFLESFKSQGGLSGPVSSLVGRLDPNLKLPRDES